MRISLLICAVVLLAGCNRISVTTGDSISNEDLEAFFRKHKVEGNSAVSLKKSSTGVASYLATIHGYPDDVPPLSVAGPFRVRG